MLRFDFCMPTRILFGPGRLSELETTPHLPPGARALIVVEADDVMLRQGFLTRVQGLLAARGVATLIHDRVDTLADAAQIDAVAAQARDSEADFVVGLGGERAIDAAKGAALLARSPGRCWDHAAVGSGPSGLAPAPLPMVAIPAAGTGAAVNGRCIVMRPGGPEMADWRHPALFPRLALVDPELAATLPAETVVPDGLYAFCQAAETLLAPSSQPAGDMLALEAVQVLGRYLPRTKADGVDMETRTLLMWAETATGMSTAQTDVRCLPILAHALSGGAPDLPRGAALAALATAYFQRIGQRRPGRMALLADAMGAAETGVDGPTRFAGALAALLKTVGLTAEVPPFRRCHRKGFDDWTRAALAAIGGQGEEAAAMMAPAEIESLLTQAFGRASEGAAGA